MYGWEVLVEAGKTVHVDLEVTAHLKENVKSIRVDTAAVEIGEDRISGLLEIGGEMEEDERIVGGIYGGSQIRYRSHMTYYLRQPLASVQVDRSGRFAFEGLAPGRYVLYFWFDVNGNGMLEPGVDVTSGLSQVLSVVGKESHRREPVRREH